MKVEGTVFQNRKTLVSLSDAEVGRIEEALLLQEPSSKSSDDDTLWCSFRDLAIQLKVGRFAD